MEFLQIYTPKIHLFPRTRRIVMLPNHRGGQCIEIRFTMTITNSMLSFFEKKIDV